MTVLKGEALLLFSNSKRRYWYQSNLSHSTLLRGRSIIIFRKF